MTPDEFRSELRKQNVTLPKFVEDYIDGLEKKSNKKKTVYTVRHIYQHDMDVEHRKVYSGTDPKKALEKCYETLQWVQDTCEGYLYPFEHDFEQKFPGKKWMDVHFNGLQIKQFFIDYIKECIKNKQSINYDLMYNGDWDPENEGEAGGFELDITEV
jgi:DNA-directed RNA polymerase subunit L